ncbi:hypothetical protein BOTBODRAFT_36439 [Botryobasidium botryosum FD-172 SS1]|uniref:Holocytochrome c-type synthase n=1 Tax=Botryobasidium botryosum (strain FD-172 SS1) TaxID=930990 RepID=A0A067M304_BOTB1|nr:hypothetical protein BOTBODRAFT_36439 [Botryobasidium botryosum FD-172 SS1]
MSHQEDSVDKCPVDHATRAAWITANGPNASPPHPTASPTSEPQVPPRLPTDREVSSIPRTGDQNWVYPSQAQFFAAMARKNHNPQEQDMRVVVPIHNAVNERAWGEVLRWESGRGGEKCGGVKLVSFKGKPQERSIKAKWNILLGYSPPFDRHDWIVDRCGVQQRYIIDFYTGRSAPSSSPSSNSAPPNLSFFLDVRPAMDSWDGVKLRAEHLWNSWVGAPAQERLSPKPSPTSPTAKPAQ